MIDAFGGTLTCQLVVPAQEVPVAPRVRGAQLCQCSSSLGVCSTGDAPSLLIGKLFDEQGKGLTPTHTKKGQRRYRYYVSRSLLKDAATEGWRVAAAELEGIVVAAAAKMLDDRKLLLDAAEQHDLDTAGRVGAAATNGGSEPAPGPATAETARGDARGTQA